MDAKETNFPRPKRRIVIWESVRRGFAFCDLGNALLDETRLLADSLRSSANRVEMAWIQAGCLASGNASNCS